MQSIPRIGILKYNLNVFISEKGKTFMKRQAYKSSIWILVACMIFTMFPVSAFAADPPDHSYTATAAGQNDGRVQSLSLEVNGSTITAVMRLKDPVPENLMINQSGFQGMHLWSWGMTFSDGKSLYELCTYRETYQNGSEQIMTRTDAFGDVDGSFYSALWKDYRYNTTDGNFVVFFSDAVVDRTFDVALGADYKTITWTLDMAGVDDIDFSNIKCLGYRLTDPTTYHLNGSEKYADTYSAGYYGSGFAQTNDDLDLDNAIDSAPYNVTYSKLGATSGAVPTDNTSYASGNSVTVKGNTGNLKKTGYTFGGWTIRPIEEGDSDYNKPPLTTLTVKTDTTLYPLWIAGGSQTNDFDVEITGGPFTYTGSSIAPTITVKTTGNTPATLTLNTDYTVSYKKNGQTAASVVGAGNYTAVITGIGSYAGSTAEESFTVAKATPTTPPAPTGLTAVYGQTLSDVSLGSGFSWQDPASTSVGNAGANTFHAKYTPSDTENYNEVSDISVNIAVSKANQTPVLALSSATGLVGLTPPALSLSGTGGTGALHYTSSSPDIATVDSATGVITILKVGTTNFTVAKDGDDNHNDSGTSNSVALTVMDKVELTVKDTAATDAAALAQLKNQGQVSVGDTGTNRADE